MGKARWNILWNILDVFAAPQYQMGFLDQRPPNAALPTT